MNQGYTKAQRILSRSQFASFAHRKKTFSVQGAPYPYPILEWYYSALQIPRIGITVTKKQGGSVQRNKFKRLVREAFRTSPFSQSHIGLDCNIRLRGPILIEREKGIFQFSIQLSDLQLLFHEFYQYILAQQLKR